jgi:hypothetical protein
LQVNFDGCSINVTDSSTPAVTISESNGGVFNIIIKRTGFGGDPNSTGPHMVLSGSEQTSVLKISNCEFSNFTFSNQHTTGELYFISPIGGLSYVQGPGDERQKRSYILNGRLERSTTRYPLSGPEFFHQVNGGQLVIIGSELERYDVSVGGTGTTLRLIGSQIVTNTQQFVVSMTGATGCSADVVGSYIEADTFGTPPSSIINIGTANATLYMTGNEFVNDRTFVIDGVGTYIRPTTASSFVASGSSTIAGIVTISTVPAI